MGMELDPVSHSNPNSGFLAKTHNHIRENLHQAVAKHSQFRGARSRRKQLLNLKKSTTLTPNSGILFLLIKCFKTLNPKQNLLQNSILCFSLAYTWILATNLLRV